MIILPYERDGVFIIERNEGGSILFTKKVANRELVATTYYGKISH